MWLTAPQCVDAVQDTSFKSEYRVGLHSFLERQGTQVQRHTNLFTILY